MNKKLLLVLALIIILVILFLSRFFGERRPPTGLRTASGIQTTEFQAHDSVLFDASDLSANTGYRVQIVREDGKIATESLLSTTQEGRIPETVIWYDIAVLPCRRGTTDLTSVTEVSEREITDSEYLDKNYTLKIFKDDTLVRQMSFRVKAGIRPYLYAADARGCPQSGFLIGEEDVWVVGKNFPKGSVIKLWAVPTPVAWKDGDALKDMTRQFDAGVPPVFELKPDDTGFKKLLWSKGLTSIGSYDIVAEVISYPFGSYHASSTAQVRNVLEKLAYSGFVIQRHQGAAEPLEQDAAGVRTSKLTFRDAFLTTENVFVGVDPYVHPTYIGKMANVYIVNDKTDAQWTVDPSLADVTGFPEVVTIQPGGCANCYSTLAWAAPLTLGKYDVVLDFDQDGQYTPGVDLIDSLDEVGFTVSEVRVESVSFNYPGSGAITIYDNLNGSIISAPEYLSANTVVKAAAWVMGGAHSVSVSFKAAPTVTSAKIWAENGLGGLNSSGSLVTVSFSGGTGQETFSVNSPPASIGKHLFDWDWKYKDVNGSPSAALEMGKTGKHILYTTYSTPNAPMATPWLEVLEYATEWASGETTEAGVVQGIVSGIYTSGMVYDGYQHHTIEMDGFNLTSVFNELRTPGLTVYMDCRDAANFFHVLTNALGFSHQYLRIPGPFTYNRILPMGQSLCNSGGWNYHQVGWCGSQVADGSAKLTCNVAAICNITEANYISLLTSTPGITSGSTGICSPY